MTERTPYRSVKAFFITFIAIVVLSQPLVAALIAFRPDLSLGSLGANLLVGAGCGAILGFLFGIQQAMTAAEPQGKVWYDYI